MLVRLTRKLANTMDGVDVSRIRSGDLIELSEFDAALFLAEGWAEPISGPGLGGPGVVTPRAGVRRPGDKHS